MSRERITVGGAPGTGKTYGWLTIARLLPKHTFHVIDPDDGVIRVWKSEFPDVENINYYFTPIWYGKLTCMECGKVIEECKCKVNQWTGGVANAYTDIKKKAKANDWVVVEMLSNLWAMAQSGFVAEVFEEGIGTYFLKARKEMKEGSKRLDALKGWTDWQVINKMHNDDFMIPICYQLPCHVYMTTSPSVLMGSEQEDADIKAFYGDTKIRLDGQKANPFRAQSIFLFRRGRGGIWYYSTFLKDRGRSFVEDEELWDFGLQYLVGVAGFDID